MKQSQPKFNLKQICPVCEQGSCLVFNTCPECKDIVIICDEEGSIFPNPNDLTKILNIYDSCEDVVCPNCKKIKIEKFSWSTGEEIQSKGFTINEYE